MSRIGPHFEVHNFNPDSSRTGQQFSSVKKLNYNAGSKKFPFLKFILAVASLVILVAGSKYVFRPVSANPTITMQPNPTSSVLGEQTSQLQIQSAASASPTSLATIAQAQPQATPEASAPTPEPDVIKIVSTPTGYLNVRDQPSLDGSIIGKVFPGSTYAYSTEQDGWYLILLQSKRHGWINAEYAEAVTK